MEAKSDIGLVGLAVMGQVRRKNKWWSANLQGQLSCVETFVADVVLDGVNAELGPQHRRKRIQHIGVQSNRIQDGPMRRPSSERRCVPRQPMATDVQRYVNDNVT